MAMKKGHTHGAPPHRGFMAWALLIALLCGQLGVGPGVLAAWTGGGDACGNPACPCDAATGAGLGASDDTAGLRDDPCAAHDGCPDGDGCRDHDPDGPCPPDCDDCSCCPGVIIAVMPIRLACLERPPARVTHHIGSGAPARGIFGRIFRPPRPSLI